MLILTKQERLVLVFLCLASLMGIGAHIFLKESSDTQAVKETRQNPFKETKENSITQP